MHPYLFIVYLNMLSLPATALDAHWSAEPGSSSHCSDQSEAARTGLQTGFAYGSKAAWGTTPAPMQTGEFL